MKYRIVVLAALFPAALAFWAAAVIPAAAQDADTARACRKRPEAMAGLVAGGQFDEQAARLERELYRHRTELMALLAAPEVDEAKARQVQKAIVEAMVKLADRRFDQALEYKKKNPDWQPGFVRSHAGGRGGLPFGP